jgi:hypothetical protein
MTIWWIGLRALTMGWTPPQIDEFRGRAHAREARSAEVGFRCADAVHAEEPAVALGRVVMAERGCKGWWPRDSAAETDP